jgi:hypothetical protein
MNQLTERMQIADPIALVDHVIDVMHKPPQTDVTKQLIADIRAEYEAGAQGYYLPRPTMKWLLDALPTEERGPFVVGDGGSRGEHMFRTLDQGVPKWTIDLDEALQFSRRKDAELFAAEDEDAWVILPVGKEGARS